MTLTVQCVNGSPSSATADDDIMTRYEYVNGHMSKMWADIDGDAVEDAGVDQVTTYTYGVAKGTSPGDSNAASGSLLQKVTYLDSGGSSDVVTFAYNALGQEMWKKDQAGSILETEYDLSGRIIHKRATTIAGGLDTTVQRISMTYNLRGQTELVTQYDDDVAGSVTDEVKYTYEDWGNISTIDQDRDGTVGGGGHYTVSWTYAKATGGRNTIRRTGITYPGSGSAVTWLYNYASGIDANASRVSNVGNQPSLAFVPYVTYKYNGVANVMRTYLEEPDAFYDLDGTSARTYTDLDRFNRVLGSVWTKDLGTDRDFYSVSISYDRDSNITDITDNVLRSASGGGGNRNFDVKYSIDNLNRVTKADEGTFSTGSISNRSREEEWILTQTGNWDRNKLDLNGDLVYTGGGELDDTRTHNEANELLTRDTDSNASVNYTQAHDAVGNMTDDGQSYKFIYDVFGRLRTINNQSNQLVEQYRYNGVNQRLSWHYDTTGNGTTDGGDKTYYFCYDDQWRMVATFRETDASPKERFLYHAAGLSGRGGAGGGIGGYIDHVVFRDKDANTAWTTASDTVLEDRKYFCQNWRADVSAVLTSNGKMVECVKYSAYGTPFALPAGDTDSDGDWDATDSGNISGSLSYNVRQDADLSGAVGAADVTHANSITGTYQTLGRGVLSSASVASRKGYAGYENDGAITRFDHVRNRVYDKTLGRWTRRDSAGYAEGANLYGAFWSNAVAFVDTFGLAPASSVTYSLIPGSHKLTGTPNNYIHEARFRLEATMSCPLGNRFAWIIQAVRRDSLTHTCVPPGRPPVPDVESPSRYFYEAIRFEIPRYGVNSSTKIGIDDVHRLIHNKPSGQWTAYETTANARAYCDSDVRSSPPDEWPIAGPDHPAEGFHIYQEAGGTGFSPPLFWDPPSARTMTCEPGDGGCRSTSALGSQCTPHYFAIGTSYPHNGVGGERGDATRCIRGPGEPPECRQ